jgi:hypothetical protein
VKIDWCGRLFPRARVVVLIPVHVHRPCSTEFIVVRAIGVEKCANDFFARRVRPIGLAGELRHGSPLSVEDEDLLTGRSGFCVTFPQPQD